MRELTKKELELIGGGYETNEIVVTGGDDGDWGDWWGDWGGDYGDDYGGDSGGGGDGGDSGPPPNEFPCENTAVSGVAGNIAAADASDGLSGTGQVEYGATIASAGGNFITGDLVTGQSYNQANPPSTTISPPAGYGWADVVATVHSHPPSGDAATDLRNQAPSDGDWQSADEAVARGADPANFTMYIIDMNGTMRAFDYMTPAARGATASNPSGTQTSGSDGTVVTPGGGCGG